MSKLTQAERDKLPLSAFGAPAGREYPVLDQDDLDAAARLIGKAPESERAAIRKRLIAIAKRLGLTLPESWSAPKSGEAPIEHKALDFDLKAMSGEGHGSFEGLVAAFNNVDAVGDIIAPGAFEGGLKEFLRVGFVGGLGHDWKTPIGHPVSARETPEGLYIKAVFDNTPAAQAVRAQMTPHPESGRATIGRLSIGYKTAKARPLDSADDCKAYWAEKGYTPNAQDVERAGKGVRLLTELNLIEGSPVLIPANTLAQVTGVKSAEPAGFAETSRKVASIARESSEGFGAFVRLAAKRADIRLKEGRVLSESNRRAMRDVLDQHRALIGQHGELCDTLAGILDRTAPPAKGDEALPETPVAESAIDHDAITARLINSLALLSV